MKKRLDILLVEKNLVTGRDKAKSIIMSGIVYVNNQKADKAGIEVTEEDIVEIRGETLKYVSRGGLKLEKAIAAFGLNLEGYICCDFGASTGGFTDCMLQNGAKKVYAFDVGYGQLAWSLRTDERVINYERTNVRNLSGDEVSEKIDLISIDVSFISLSKVLPAAFSLLKDQGLVVCLVKPQFEAGREKVGKKGVVRDPETHKEVIHKAIGFSQEFGFAVKGLSFSPIKGPEGNIEYLLLLCKEASAEMMSEIDVNTVVDQAHGVL